MEGDFKEMVSGKPIAEFLKVVFPSPLNQLRQKFSTQNAVKDFQGCDLYLVNKAEVEKRIVAQMLLDNSTSTSKEASETPSNSKETNGFPAF